MDSELRALHRKYLLEPEAYREILERHCRRIGVIGPTLAEACVGLGRRFARYGRKDPAPGHLISVEGLDQLFSVDSRMRNLGRRLRHFNLTTSPMELESIPTELISAMTAELRAYYLANRINFDKFEIEVLPLLLLKKSTILCHSSIRRLNLFCGICQEAPGSSRPGGCDICLPRCLSCGHRAHNSFASAAEFGETDCSLKCDISDCNSIICSGCYYSGRSPRNNAPTILPGALELDLEWCQKCNKAFCPEHVGKCMGQRGISGLSRKQSCDDFVCALCGIPCIKCGKILACANHLKELPQCVAISEEISCDAFTCEECKDYFNTCEICKRLACTSHSNECEICDKIICIADTRVCEFCDKKDSMTICKSHGGACSYCKRNFCDDCESPLRCVFDSPKSKNRYCLKCLSFCPACQGNPSQTVICKKHSAECYECHQNFCLDHLDTCVGCNKGFCPSCSQEHGH